MLKGLTILAALVVAVAVAPVRADQTFDLAPALMSDVDWATGKQAFDRKDWAGATASWSRALVRHPDSADLHNMLGFSYRNMKQFDKAFEHYKRAIALDPRHRGAHEYIGEAYLMVGDLPNAERHLDALRSICLLSCEERDDLEKAVASYRTAKGLPAK